MNINDPIKKTTGVPVTSPQSTQLRAGTPATKVDTTPTTTSDSVKLSPQYQALESQVSVNESFDAQKVEEIKTAITNGQFKINLEKVAAGLIDSVKNLLGTRK